MAGSDPSSSGNTDTQPSPDEETLFRVERVDVGDRQLQVVNWVLGSAEPGAPVENSRVPIVMCHDGLGTFVTFGDVPGRVARELATPVWAYNRAGHGGSTPVPDGPWPTDWLHREADVLVALIERLVGDRPVHLVGHSDGGSIALLAALKAPERVHQVTTLAAHTWVEPVCTAAIRAMRARRERMVQGLARIHEAPAEIFEAWSGVWVSEAFATWNILDRLAALAMPVTIVQGEADEYATDAMVWDTVAAVGENATGVFMPGWPHLMNRTNPDELAELVIDLHRSGG